MVSRKKRATPWPIVEHYPKTSRTPIPLAIRLDSIFKFVTATGPSTMAAIAAGLSYTSDTTRKYTRILCQEGKMYRVVGYRPNGGLMHTYHAGIPPAGTLADLMEEEDEPDEPEFARPVRKSYPPNHRRDLWACAMFPVPAVLLGTHP